MNILEKELESIIFNAPPGEISKRGLPFNGKVYRQLKIGNYGIADLITATRGDFGVHITVYELKKDEIDATALMQAYRYKRGIEQYLRLRGLSSIVASISIVLVGSKLAEGDFCYTANACYDVCYFTYQFDYMGISFKNHFLEYVLTNPGVPKVNGKAKKFLNPVNQHQ